MLLPAFALMLPFAVLFGAILVLRIPVVISAGLSLLVLIAVALGVWQVYPYVLGTALLKAVLVTADIGYILLGSLLLLALLTAVGAVTTIEHFMRWLAPDRRIQTILMSIFFVGAIEGLAGFGTPAVLATPLLVAMGFPVRIAVVVSLLGNTISVPFGAVGTPFLIGLTQGASGASWFSPALLASVVEVVVLVGLPLAVVWPLTMSCVVTALAGSSWKKGLEIWRYALLAGIVYALIYVGVALTLGPDFPALFASLLGGAFMMYIARQRKFLPHRPWHLPTSSTTSRSPHLQVVRSYRHMPSWYAVVPYAVVVSLLMVSRLGGSVRSWFQDVASWQWVLGVSTNTTHSTQLLYSPGFFLLLGCLAVVLLYRVPWREQQHILVNMMRQISVALLSLFFLVTLTQVMILSGHNASQLLSMPVFSATLVSTLPLPWVVLAPFVGFFGALTTGSVTVSNLLFTHFQAEVATLTGFWQPLILGMQVLGASAGNIIALHNIVVVLTAVHSSMERSIFKLLLVPAIAYAVWVAGAGFFLYSMGGG